MDALLSFMSDVQENLDKGVKMFVVKLKRPVAKYTLLQLIMAAPELRDFHYTSLDDNLISGGLTGTYVIFVQKEK